MRVALAALMIGLVIAGSAQGETIYVIDTGPGGPSGGRTLTQNQWLGARITLDQPYTITSIEGWMIYLWILGGMPVTAALYGDAGDVPDTSALFFEQGFVVPASGYTAGWNGVDGLSLELDAGAYWVAFEVRQQIDFGSGVMPPTPLQELDDYAFRTPEGGWVVDDSAKLGIRIGAVPEPSRVAMLASGLAFLRVIGRRRFRS